MDVIKEFIATNPKSISAGVCALGAGTILWNRYSKQKPVARPRICGVDYPKDTVILHHVSKGDNIPCHGHFVMKLETYLRITKIPYQTVFGPGMGPKNKIPWIEYNGITMGDSQLIINFLNKEFNVDLNKSLSKEDRAVAWAIQKWIEEFTYHLNVYTKWVLCFKEYTTMIRALPRATMEGFSALVSRIEYTTGIGRHSAQEVHEMMVFDVKQLSAILGNKKFIMGTDEPTEVDCAVFGIIGQVRWQTPSGCPGKQLLISEMNNLMAYLDRMKILYWPDWNECLASGSKKS